MKSVFNGQLVEITDISYGKDIVDTYVLDAYYEATGIELTITELEQLTDQLHEDGELELEHQEYWQGQAEYLYEDR